MGDPATAQSGLLAYEPFYGLHEKAFSLSTDPRFLYKSAAHTAVFKEVLAGIRRRDGLVVLTGEIGTGKTTLCRSVLGALDGTTVSAFVPDPFVSREDLLKILLVEFGVVSTDDLARGRLRGASRAELSYPLYECLRSLERLDACAVLLIDEAQSLSSSLLEELRILADLEATHRLLQVVLVGQPELSNVLQEPHMRQIRQRVTTHCDLQPLDRDGVHAYVGHRVTVAGASAGRLHFSSEALDLVFAASGGVPRLINRLCDRTLQHGHQARAIAIGPELVRLAMADLQLARARERTPAAAAPAARRRTQREAPDASRSRGMFAAAALIVLGTLTGLSIAVYWGWEAPVLAQRVALPRVRRPSMRIGAPLPAVAEPAIESIGDTIAPPHLPDPAADDTPAEAGPPRAVTTPNRRIPQVVPPVVPAR
jgi:type II secretory pathway predicted ATPase ExeA